MCDDNYSNASTSSQNYHSHSNSMDDTCISDIDIYNSSDIDTYDTYDTYDNCDTYDTYDTYETNALIESTELFFSQLPNTVLRIDNNNDTRENNVTIVNKKFCNNIEQINKLRNLKNIRTKSKCKKHKKNKLCKNQDTELDIELDIKLDTELDIELDVELNIESDTESETDSDNTDTNIQFGKLDDYINDNPYIVRCTDKVTDKCVVFMVDLFPIHKLIYETFVNIYHDDNIDIHNTRSELEEMAYNINVYHIDETYINYDDMERYFDDEKFVEYLLKISMLDWSSIYSKRMTDISTIKKIQENELSIKFMYLINKYLIEHYPNCWKNMKRGDIIQDTTVILCNDVIKSVDKYHATRGRYIISEINIDDTKIKTKHKVIEKHIHDIKDDVRQNDMIVQYLYGHMENFTQEKNITKHIPPFYIITDMPIGYFDNILINISMIRIPIVSNIIETFANNIGSSIDDYNNGCVVNIWGNTKCPIIIDNKRLGMSDINKKYIYYEKIKGVGNISPRKKQSIPSNPLGDLRTEYLYCIIEYKDQHYIIITRYVSSYVPYNMKIEKIKFIERLRRCNVFNIYDIRIDKHIHNIAKKHNINPTNILFV